MARTKWKTPIPRMSLKTPLLSGMASTIGKAKFANPCPQAEIVVGKLKLSPIGYTYQNDK